MCFMCVNIKNSPPRSPSSSIGWIYSSISVSWVNGAIPIGWIDSAIPTITIRRVYRTNASYSAIVPTASDAVAVVVAAVSFNT